MRKVNSYKCPVCGMKFKTFSGWCAHMHKIHPESIPSGYSDLRYFYYLQTGKTAGRCVQCHRPTLWNEETGKYDRYCTDPRCKQAYVKVAKGRMVDKYGKEHMLDNPDWQRKMLKERSISDTYIFKDGSGSVDYTGTYEKDFLMRMEVLGFKATDIMGPSPHNYIYIYEDEPHFYIPDFYIPNLNLEIEIKDGGNNPNNHPKIVAVDKVKEKLKDDLFTKNKKVNYFKVVNKEYNSFFNYVLDLKDMIDDDLRNNIMLQIASEAFGYTIEQLEALDLEPATENVSIKVECTDFGIPELKKYPMPDEDHVISAIRFFNHVEAAYEEELAFNILKYMKKYKMDDVNVGDNNRFKKYYESSNNSPAIS